jgi:VWFA-related protein
LASTLARSPVSAAQGQPTFRSAVQLIEVDVFVTDNEGRFVRGLRQDDFEIVEDDKPQTIQAFSFTDLPIETAVVVPAQADAPEPDVSTNNTPEGRVYVILMDSPSTAGPGGTRTGLTYDAYAKAFARQFVQEQVTTRDSVAVVHVQGTFTDSQPFTTNKQRVLASIDRYGLGLSGAISGVSIFEAIQRNLDTYRAIQDLSERLGAMSGLRKAILWVGGQIEFSPQDNCPPAGRTDGCILAGAAPTLVAAYRDAIATANRHNVAVYPIDPSGLTTDLGMGELERKAALRMVAEDTGGLAVVGTNNLGDMYQAIVRDMSTYYVLGYAPAVERRDGKFHDIKVRVKRPGVTVRARKGYFAPRPDAPTRIAPTLPDGVSTAARDALRMPLPVRGGLQIDAFGAAFKGAPDQATVVIGSQITGALRLGSGGRIAVTYQVFDDEGRVQTGHYKVFNVTPSAATRLRIEESGLRLLDRISLPPGRYEVRLVVDQPDGAVGSVVIPVDVPKFDNSLALSGVTLAASSTASDVTLQEDPVSQDAHGMSPTASRRFPRGDVLSAFAEIYTNDSRITAADLTVTGVVSSAAGQDVQRAEARAAAPARSDAPGRWGFIIEVGPLDVEPGQYVLTVEASSARHSTPLRRRIPFIVEQ